MSAAEIKRQTGIKTRAVKRLAADVKSYLVELSEHQQALDRLSSSSSSDAGSIRRAREFVEECDSTIRDVRQKLQEAYQGLQTYLADVEREGDADLLSDQCFEDARKMLEDVAPLVTVAADEPKERDFRIAVFGSSLLTEDDPMWQPTEELGQRLAEAGYHVVSGGYAGTSESLSFGASRVANARIEGVTSPAAYPGSLATQYLTDERKAGDVLERAAVMVRAADAYVVLPGGLGTLSKMSLAWNLSAAESWAAKPPLPLLAWRDPWERVVETLGEQLGVAPAVREVITYVDGVEQVMQELQKMRQHRQGVKADTPAATSSA